LRLQYSASVIFLCELGEVSSSGYYSWVTREPSKHSIEEARLEVEILAAHKRTRGTFGAERLQHDLADHGVKAGVCRIRRIRKKPGIKCRQKRKFKATTDSNHKFPVAENLLDQNFNAAEPNKIGLSDSTYIPTEEGWLYLASIVDGFIDSYMRGESVGSLLRDSIVPDEKTVQRWIRKLKDNAASLKRRALALLNESFYTSDDRLVKDHKEEYQNSGRSPHLITLWALLKSVAIRLSEGRVPYHYIIMRPL
jgi:HTH-like domain